MSTEKTPIRTVFADDGSAEGLAEFQAGEVVGYEHGGTGLDSLGSANQVLQVAANGTAIVWGNKTQVDLDPFVTKVDAVAANNSLLSLIEDRIQVANVISLINTEVSNLIDGAPGALDTLNELAAAIGDDANFFTTITNNLASKSSNTYVNATFVPKTASVQLSGDATGSATFASNTASITVDIASTGTPTGSFGSASQVPIITVSADGRITNISNTSVAGVESVAFSTANGTLTINTSDGGSKSTSITLNPFDTNDLSEGDTNLYFTTARARSAFSAGASIDITDGVIAVSDPAFPVGDYGSLASDFQTLGDEIGTSIFYDLQTPKGGLITVDLGSVS